VYKYDDASKKDKRRVYLEAVEYKNVLNE